MPEFTKSGIIVQRVTVEELLSALRKETTGMGVPTKKPKVVSMIRVAN